MTILAAVDDTFGAFFSVLARTKGSRDVYVIQSFINHIDRLGLVRAELKCDQEPSTLDVARVVAARCSSTSLVVISTPKGSKGSLGRAERANYTIQSQIRALRAAASEYFGITIGARHLLMPWIVRHASWVLNRFLIRGSGKTPYRALRGKNYTQPLAAFGECVMYRDAEADPKKLELRWNDGIFVGKLDLTEEFVVLTPRGAIKVRSVKRTDRPKEDNRELLSRVIGQPWNPQGRAEIAPAAAELPTSRSRRLYLTQSVLNRYGRTPGCNGCAGIGAHTDACRKRIEAQMVEAGDAVHLGPEAPEKRSHDDAPRETDAKKARTNEEEEARTEPHVQSVATGPGGDKADSHGGLVAALAILDYPEVDLSHERSASVDIFPPEALKRGREKEIHHLVDFDGYEELYELPSPRPKVYDTTWRDEWRGDQVRSRLCVREYKSEGSRNDTFACTPDTWFLRYVVSRASMDRDLAILIVDISVAFMHARSDEDLIVKAPAGVSTSPWWRLKAAINGTRKASRHWQEFSCEKLQLMGLLRNTFNPSIFHDEGGLTQLEQHGDDFLNVGERKRCLS